MTEEDTGVHQTHAGSANNTFHCIVDRIVELWRTEFIQLDPICLRLEIPIHVETCVAVLGNDDGRYHTALQRARSKNSGPRWPRVHLLMNSCGADCFLEFRLKFFGPCRKLNEGLIEGKRFICRTFPVCWQRLLDVDQVPGANGLCQAWA